MKTDKKQIFPEKELIEYEKVTTMTAEEQAALRTWVAEGNSVHVINVQISVSFVRWKNSSFHSSSIYTKAPYRILPAVFKCALNFFDNITNKGFHTFYHDYKIIATFIHIFNIFTAEIATI